MSFKLWPALATVLLGVSLLLAACGEETTEDPPGALPATRLNLEECSKAAASITAKPGATPPTPNAGSGLRVEIPAGTRLFISNTFPYALALPEGWEVKEGQTQGNINGDLFIIKKGSNSGAYVTVISEKVNGPEDSKAYFDAKFKEASAAQKIEFENQGTRPVGTSTAYILAFNTPAGQPFAYPVQSLELLFAGQERGWGITFTASPTLAAQYCPYFARMLDSWTFTGLKK